MGEALVQGIDFEAAYSNNDKAADKDSETPPKAVATGIGKYVGTIEQTFTILPKELTEEMAAPATVPYNGTVQDDIVIQNNGIRLEKGTDYTITFQKEPRNEGTYTAAITGMNNYAGTLDVPLTIAKTVITEDMVTTSDGTSIIPAQAYTGTAVKPAPQCAGEWCCTACWQLFRNLQKQHQRRGKCNRYHHGKGAMSGKSDKNLCHNAQTIRS